MSTATEMVKFENLRTDIDIEAFKKLQKELAENAIAVLSTEFKRVFDTFPEVLGIVWTQYTPYFNDGDACEFNIHDINFRLSEEAQLRLGTKLEDVVTFDPNDVESFWESDIPYSAKDDSLRDAEKKLNTFASSFENLFKEAFGDHAQIVCTREGFQIDEYEHD